MAQQQPQPQLLAQVLAPLTALQVPQVPQAVPQVLPPAPQPNNRMMIISIHSQPPKL